MSSVFRERNGAGFWGTGVGGVSTLPVVPGVKARALRGRGLWYKRAPKIKPKDVNGTRELTTSADDKASSPLRPLILSLLREYHLTGLTTPDMAALLGEDNGRVMGVVRTLVTRGLVKTAGKVWSSRGKHGQRIHQWKLTEKIAEAAD